jgi:RND family efflux transporter MFP subunit
MKTFLTLIVLAACTAAGFYFYQNKPQARRAKPAPIIPVVQTITLEPGDYPIFLESFGTVTPEKELTVVTEVAGIVEAKNPSVTGGGHLAKGQLIAQIETTRYDIVAQYRQAAVAEAEHELELEAGRQLMASRELALFEEDSLPEGADRRLVLREPQMAQAQARLDAARANLEEALLNVARTTVTAPFNSLVLEHFFEAGQYVTTHAPLVRLAATDRFEVIVSVPVARLRYISLPDDSHQTGATVAFTLGDDANSDAIRKDGHVTRLLGEIDPANRMARLVVSIDDPLGLNSAPAMPEKLLLGSYVRAEISCGVLPSVYRIPAEALHDNNQIWLLDQGRLRITTVDVAWSRRDDVLTTTPLAGARLITSRLQNPLPGMELKVEPGSNGNEI